jgi:tetratricopeptide (TPR) repeat protein
MAFSLFEGFSVACCDLPSFVNKVNGAEATNEDEDEKNLCWLMNDITAAALAYGIYKTDMPVDKPTHVAFVDCGAMDTTVAIISFVKGKLTVLSGLGQPLNAEIEVVSLQPGERETLQARLASLDAFRQAIRINPADGGFWQNLGMAYNDSARYNDAINAFREAFGDDSPLAEWLRPLVGARVSFDRFLAYLLVHGPEAQQPDLQRRVHCDTFHETFKLWYFFDAVTPAQGPLMYSPGSHRNTTQRLRWEQRMAPQAGVHRCVRLGDAMKPLRVRMAPCGLGLLLQDAAQTRPERE